jgi:aminoglycoside phosphotransferase (APT) family kinase protein
MDLGFLPALIADALGGSTQLVTHRPVVERHDYTVVIGTIAPSMANIVVKLAGAAAPHWATADAFERAPVLSRVLRQQGLVVPEVLAINTSAERWPIRYLITSFIPGVTWASASTTFDDDDRAVLFAEFGEAVARVHELSFATFGNLGPLGDVLDGGTYAEALAQRAGRRIASHLHVELFQSLLDRLDIADVGPPALTHEDLNPTNLVVERRGQTWHLASILDFDSAWAGNPESDLARLEVWRGMMHPAFWPAYRTTRRVAATYESRRTLLQLLWCLEYASPSPDHLAVTATVCHKLDIPPVRFG